MKLLDYLHRGGACAHYWTPDSGEFYTNQDTGETQQRKLSIWFPVEKRLALPASWATKNVYFCVHPQTAIPEKFGKASGKRVPDRYVKAWLRYVAAINCFFGEFDVKDYGSKEAICAHIDKLPLRPTVIVDSGGGYHCYWILEEPHAITDENRDEVKRVQYAWVDLVGSDGDAKDLARVLRVPGTKNLKPAYAPDFPTVTTIAEDYALLYQYEQFSELTKHLRNDKPVIHRNSGHSYTDQIETATKALKALNRHRSESYASWVEVGMSLSALGDAGLRLWDEWSQGSGKYQQGACDSKWRSFQADSGIGIGSLVKWAKEDDPSFALNGHSNGNRQPKDPQHGYGLAAPVTTETTVEVAAPAEGTPEDLDAYFITQSADDEGNAQCVNKIHGSKFLYCDAYGWMQSVGTHWIYGGLAEKDLHLAITQTLIDRRVAAVKRDYEKIIKATKPASTNKNNVKNQFKDIVWCDVSDFDKEKHLLNCQNGIINLRTGELLTREPSSRFSYCVNAEYDPGAPADPWLNFLSSTVKDYDAVGDWLQMACGYSITGFTSEEVMFYLFGPARSGKGTFTNAFLHMLGQPLALGVNFSTFTSRRDGDSQNFDLAPLKPARFVAASESDKNRGLNEAVIKQITGNDPIRASYKGKDHFTYFPQFKIWLSSNHPVRGDVDDDAFWGRVKVVEFPNSHLGNEDKSLKGQMQSPEYCKAILAWAVGGAMRWCNESKGLTTPETVKASVATQRAQLDSVQRWLDQCAIRLPHINTTNEDLRASYEHWCRDNGEAPKFAVQFGRAMSAKGYESVSFKQRGLLKRGFKGVALLTEATVYSNTPASDDSE